MNFRDHTINDIHKNLYFWTIKNNKPLKVIVSSISFYPDCRIEVLIYEVNHCTDGTETHINSNHVYPEFLYKNKSDCIFACRERLIKGFENNLMELEKAYIDENKTD